MKTRISFLLLWLFVVIVPANLHIKKAFARDLASIKIGVFMDLSGATASFGRSTLNGIEIAVDEVNKAGGVEGLPIELIVKDDKGESELAADFANKLIIQDKVIALIGEVSSSRTLAAAPIAQAARIPLIAPTATHPAITRAGDYIFRTCFTDPSQAEAMAKYAATTLRARRAAILTNVTSDYSRLLVSGFKEKFHRLGGQVVVEQSYAEGDRDYAAQLMSIRSSKPDILYIPGYYTEAGPIAKQARRLGLKLPLLGSDGWDSSQLWYLGGRALNGSYLTEQYSVDDPAPANQKFVRSYKSRYNGSEPDTLAALGYDAMLVLAGAIKRAGTTTGAKVRDALAQTRNLSGATGNITINSQRNAIKSVVVLKVFNRKFIYKQRVQPDRAVVNRN